MDLGGALLPHPHSNFAKLQEGVRWLRVLRTSQSSCCCWAGQMFASHCGGLNHTPLAKHPRIQQALMEPQLWPSSVQKPQAYKCAEKGLYHQPPHHLDGGQPSPIIAAVHTWHSSRSACRGDSISGGIWRWKDLARDIGAGTQANEPVCVKAQRLETNGLFGH
jgi:hypothetical protein